MVYSALLLRISVPSHFEVLRPVTHYGPGDREAEHEIEADRH
jgi:hypothetical protein